MTEQARVLVVAKRVAPEFEMLRDIPHVLTCDPRAADSMLDIAVMLQWSGSREMVREAFAQCKDLRWIHSRYAGVDSWIFPELVDSDVVLTNAKGVYSESLGEFGVAAILYFAKDIARLRRDQAAGKWAPFAMEMIAGRVLGIVGYGNIGRAVAERAHAMGMRIVATKRHVPKEPDPLIERYYSPAELREMLGICDYVLVAAPLTPETRNMMSDAEFAAMKPTGVLINLGRGPVVDTDALVRALNSGQIKGAALDVVEPEPLPAGHPLYGMENVLLSPHCADQVAGWTEDAMQFFLEQYGRFEKGKPLLNVVNKRLGY